MLSSHTPCSTRTPTPTQSGPVCVSLKNYKVDQASKRPCTEAIAAGMDPKTLAVTQVISRNGNTFTTNQVFSPTPGDDMFVSWWVSDKSYDKSNWDRPGYSDNFKLLYNFPRLDFPATQAVLDGIKGKYLVVRAVYNYKRLYILDTNGLSVLVPIGVASVFIP